MCQTSQFCAKMVHFLFSAYFGGRVCYHSNGKSQSNLKLLHFGYCFNKLKRKIGKKKQFLYFSLIGGGGGGAKIFFNARSSLYCLCCIFVGWGIIPIYGKVRMCDLNSPHFSSAIQIYE